jgi:hypothetical protein
MAIHEEEYNNDRREFLRTAVLTTLAATASGVGATVLARRTAVAPAAAPLITTVSSTAPVVTASNEALTDLFARLAAAEADNVRLQAELDAARRNLDAAHTTSNSSSVQTEALNGQLASANQQIGVLSGLIALYDQVEAADVSGLVEDGLTAVADSLNGLVNRSPLLSDGVAIGQMALSELENNIPLLENGRAWLDAHQARLNAYFITLEVLLQNAVERVGPFLEMVGQWFQDLRKWLPFNLGERTAEVMTAATNLLGETPHTISGLDTNVAQALDVWLVRDDEDIHLRRAIIKPLREQVLDNAQAMTAEVSQTHLTFQERLAAPWQTAVAQQRQLREQIAQYRQEHQV